ncbi:hypothetical protein [Stenotrophomonas sp.]|uniref:hypothetical protein n=1 Tax=Stenotrophomonas sp. TaxID=69392 RepID=UPI00289BA332|nr:hypothetical protein [Stenotrophomonas sp.]
MSLIPTIYRSTDPGAPVLSGQAGSLLALLHAVLVTGYGSGASLKSGAGWTCPFSSSTVHVYRNSSISGSGAYLRVRDDASADMLNSPCLAQAIGYSAMSDIDTGENRTPSLSMQARGSLIAKAPPGNTAPREWIAIATEIGFYLFTDWSIYNRGRAPYYFGDLISSVGGDAYPFAMFGSADLTTYSGTWSDYVMSVFWSTELSSELPAPGGDYGARGQAGGFTMRSYSSGAAAPGRLATVGFGAAGTSRYSYGTDIFPSGKDKAHGGYNFTRALVKEAPFTIRGHLPGLLVPLHLRPYADGEHVSYVEGMGVGDWVAINYNTAEPDIAARDGQVLFHMDAPWK